MADKIIFRGVDDEQTVTREWNPGRDRRRPGDDGGCGPDESNIISQQTIYEFNEQTASFSYYYNYDSELTPVPLEPGKRYWICIRAALEIDAENAYSEWYWALHDDEVECPALYRCAYSGFPDFVRPHEIDPEYPGADAMAFCLFTDGTVPTALKTWGDVKTLFH